MTLSRPARPRDWGLWAAGSGVVLWAIYCVSLASSGPWDPWETHYGEVARQINLRRDPLDLWWRAGNDGPDARDEGTFWSKPPLAFWLLAVSLRLFGVGLGADPAEMVSSPWTEVALRLPGMLVGFAAAVTLGALTWRLVAPAAGWLVAVVLLTMPQWAMVTRQAMTDMFFVAPVVMSLCAWMAAVGLPSRPLATRGRGWREVPWDRAYLGFGLLLVIAAIVPLVVLHEHLGNPSMAARAHRMGRLPELRTAFAHLFVYWALLSAIVVVSLRWRQTSQVLMALVYLFAGLSLLGKGLIGPGLVGVVILAHIAVTGHWRWLRRAGLGVGILVFAVVAFPWHHAMIVFRGERFVNEWVVLHNLTRFASGEQDQAVGGFTYYVETAGLAAMPWIAVVPLAVARGIRAFASRPGPDDPLRPSLELTKFALIWTVVALWAVSYSVTKYYHYLLPVLPALALLVGAWLHDIGKTPRAATSVSWVGPLVGLALLGLALRDALAEPAWLAHLTTYLYVGMWRTGAPDVGRLLLCCVPFAVGLALLVGRRARAAVAAMVLSGVLTTVYVVDDYLPATSENWSQRSAMRVYFDRRGPHDRLVSWWFYYRGETFFSKGDIWVLKEPDHKVLRDFVEEHRQRDMSLWFITTSEHAGRLADDLPADLRDDLAVRYRSFHYVLLELPMP